MDKKFSDLIGYGVMFLICGAVSAWQIIRWEHGHLWIFFRISFIPIPLILITGFLTIGALYYFIKEILTVVKLKISKEQ